MGEARRAGMKQGALRQVRREATQRRLSFLVSTAEDVVHELWRSELDYAAADRLTLEVRIVQVRNPRCGRNSY